MRRRAPASVVRNKEGYTTIAFEVTVLHTKWIIAVTIGNPGARNDKPICRYDQFILSIKEGRLWRDVEIKLRRRNGDIITITGVHLIVDGGYHQWRCLQAVEKHSSEEWSRAFSKSGESLRKDVECTFGIMKQRFRLLQGRISLSDRAQVDNAFISSCILHNMLLFDDGWAEKHLNPVFWQSNNGAEPMTPSDIFPEQVDDDDGMDDEDERIRNGPNAPDYSVA